MKVIFAGFSKCGTKTIAQALRDLGYNVYDFMENYEFLGDKWMKIFQEGGTKEDFYEMYKDVDAVTDMPCFYFWKQILEAFPDAKIVFAQRGSEDEWWRSFQGQMDAGDNLFMQLMRWLSPTSAKMSKFGYVMFRTVFGFNYDYGLIRKSKVNEMLCRHTYNSHNAYVLNSAPKDQLLFLDFKEGWAPLCKFLDVPIPDKPFPHRNKKGSINQELLDTHPLFKRIQIETVASGSLVVCFTAYTVYKYFTWPSDSPSIYSYLTASAGEGITKLGLFE